MVVEKGTNQDQLFIDDFCAILVRHKMIKEQDVPGLCSAFEQNSALYFEEFLLTEEFVTKENLLQALELYYNLPSMDVVGVFFDHHLVRMFPKDVMLRNGFIPYDRDGDVLIVVASRPNNPKLAEIIGKFVSYDVTFLVGIYQDITDAAKEFYDESIEQAELELFEDNTDEHEKHPVDDAFDKNEQD